MSLSRRTLLRDAGVLALAAALPSAARASDRKTLLMQTRQIEVGGKSATRFKVSQPSGAFGLILREGDEFDVQLENRLSVPAGLHWHGLTEPWRQDGVPYLSGPPLEPGTSRHYVFPAIPPGTRWMHSHFGFEEQNLLAAPLIIRETSAIREDRQEIVIFLEDFTWSSPNEIFERLRNRPPGSMAMRPATSAPDLNDVEYDAYLANDRTLDDPDVVRVERNADVRLRIINASASSNFIIDLGGLEGTLITVDGNPVVPIVARRFPIAIAQRADIMVRVPADAGAVPILAVGEGRRLRTGIILQPPGAAVSKIGNSAEQPGPEVTLEQELLLKASAPLPAKPINRSIPIDLTGNMMAYYWDMPIHGTPGLPATANRGERVEIVFRNMTMMSHPMHLHGHVFQVTQINDRPINGAIRDTILVPPKTTVKVVFDADNPGLWALHCHNLYHMAGGMFSTLVYRGIRA